MFIAVFRQLKHKSSSKLANRRTLFSLEEALLVGLDGKEAQVQMLASGSLIPNSLAQSLMLSGQPLMNMMRDVFCMLHRSMYVLSRSFLRPKGFVVAVAPIYIIS